MLATKALNYLPCPDYGKRDAILAKLRILRVCGCQDVSEHFTDMNHHVDPVVNKGAQIPLTPRTPCGTADNARYPRQVADSNQPCLSAGAFCPGPATDIRHEDHPENGWNVDLCNPNNCSTTAITDWKDTNDPTLGFAHGYADLIALEILNYRNRGMSTDSLWTLLLNDKWDGIGMNDQAVTDSRSTPAPHYDTYKLALFKICARVLNKTLPTGVDDKITQAQIAPGPGTPNNKVGGIRTQYDLNGNFVLDQNGNCETTSLVVLAYLKPMSDF